MTRTRIPPVRCHADYTRRTDGRAAPMHRLGKGGYAVVGYTPRGTIAELSRFSGEMEANLWARYLALESEIEGYLLIAVERVRQQSSTDYTPEWVSRIPDAATLSLHAWALASQARDGQAPNRREMTQYLRTGAYELGYHLTALEEYGLAVRPPNRRFRWRFLPIPEAGG